MTRRDGFNFIDCIHSEKTSISAMSVVGIFIYIPSTLPDRRKGNPGFTNSPFNILQVHVNALQAHLNALQGHFNALQDPAQSPFH